MRISPINIYPINIQQPKKQVNFTARINKVDSVEFTHDIYRKALNKLSKINKKEYNSLSDMEKSILRKRLSYLNQGMALEHLERHFSIADAISNFFNQKYGENNYKIIAIGRSVSSIGKLLGMKIGEKNVVNIPMSNLNRWSVDSNAEPSVIDSFLSIDGINNLKKYIQSKGLKKKHKENYIILDYTYSGDSLKNAYKILTSEYFLGKENITKCAINDIIRQKIKNPEKMLLDLTSSEYKNYSYVAHVRDYKDMEYITDYRKFAKDYKQDTIKLFGFGLLDKLYCKSM